MTDMILIIHSIAIIGLVILHFKFHKRFSIHEGMLMWCFNWDSQYKQFVRGRSLFRVIPKIFYQQDWFFYYKGERVCSGQCITAYTRKGAIRKLSKTYDLNLFNLDRI